MSIYMYPHTHTYTCRQTEKYMDAWMWTGRDRERGVGQFHDGEVLNGTSENNNGS